MTLEPWIVGLYALLYLLSLFGLATLSEKNIIPVKISRSPLIHTLAQGTFISAWGYYGIISLAQNYGYGALAYYLGAGAMLLFAPFLLIPMSRIANQFQLNSFADLMVFRFPSAKLGVSVTLILLVSALPLLALQIKAVAEAWQVLKVTDIEVVSLNWTHATLFVIVTTVFTLVFGSGRLNLNGLVVALAAESILKLVGILAVGIVATFMVFNGIDDLNLWLAANPDQTQILYQVRGQNNSPWLVLIFLSGSILVPHAFNYNNGRKLQLKTLRMGSWLIPMYLMLMALPLFPIIWAANSLDAPLANTDYAALGIALALENPWLLIIILFGGLSAATGTMVVVLLTITSMTLNHLILPSTGMPSRTSLYQWLARWQRYLVVILAAASLLFCYLVADASLTDLAFTAFMGTLQLTPALCALVLWPEARGRAISAGLLSGGISWFLFMVVPLVLGYPEVHLDVLGVQVGFGPGEWQTTLLASFGLNVVVMVVLHNITQQTEEELAAAKLCGLNDISVPSRERLVALTPQAMIEALSPALGKPVAMAEVRRALKQQSLSLNERRPSELRKTRDQIEANLSGLMGPSIAKEVVDDSLPMREVVADDPVDLVQLEQRLSESRSALPGMAAELDRLRRHHRNTLEQMPIGVATFTTDFEIMLWNKTLENITHISPERATGTAMTSLPEPWGSALHTFVSSGNNFQRLKLMVDGKRRFLDLSKARRDRNFKEGDSRILLVEDRTEIEQLQEQLLHKERLSSIGRLAAGVAHEIGNPVTGITCLAQELEEGVSGEDAAEIAAQIQVQTGRISNIVQSMVNFSHPADSSDLSIRIDINRCINDAIALLALQHHRKSVNYINNLAESIEVMGDPTRLTQVFVNLLGNARDASDEGADINISARRRGQWCFLQIQDDGHGIDAKHIKKLFDPFFTTKEVGQGTGLGLAIVYNIIRQHGGEIDVASPKANQTQGTEFTISLPLAAKETD
ncbi:ATP-binding protein [uncultured Umboniibacter sp.]|uniref:ATP-binding protein n=1 Tax=uncultured Umboniibacter sp. TaxID=1798917 RepID=UPI00260AE096|nr:ATP-binding protein [uncultured Umboniibacter sp.]